MAPDPTSGDEPVPTNPDMVDTTRVRIDCPEGSLNTVRDLLAKFEPPIEDVFVDPGNRYVVVSLTEEQIMKFNALEFNFEEEAMYSLDTPTTAS